MPASADIKQCRDGYPKRNTSHFAKEMLAITWQVIPPLGLETSLAHSRKSFFANDGS